MFRRHTAHDKSADGTRYPLVITCRDIKPGATKAFNVSLRFGPAGAQVQDLSRDVLERYAKKYPFQRKLVRSSPYWSDLSRRLANQFGHQSTSLELQWR